ncbi:hypothetical protein VNO80_24017 [Phaseolus coccineus]|uniref:Uncharacterized protein n=1 Tax=Phaseolus coccineus TaxID=3886 RepID=A0AAN9LWU7_PHACN
MRRHHHRHLLLVTMPSNTTMSNSVSESMPMSQTQINEIYRNNEKMQMIDLRLNNCSNVVSVSVSVPEGSTICVPAIKCLEIEECPNLKSVLHNGLTIPNLQSLILKSLPKEPICWLLVTGGDCK